LANFSAVCNNETKDFHFFGKRDFFGKKVEWKWMSTFVGALRD
jgi:hypothetical protein